MISKEKLIALFERMYKEHWAYALGAARERCVDCSGAFVYAYKVLGGGTIEHGSNAIARKRVGTWMSPAQANPGYAAFKRRAFDPEKCPAKYDDGREDCYHIGLVDATGRYVLNAKSTKDGFSRDPIAKWDFVAPLTAVQYDEKGGKNMEVLCRMVIATQKDPLRIRDAPETGAVVGYAPRGAMVDVLELGGWARIRYNGIEGYASWAYLEAASGDSDLVTEPKGTDGEAAGNTTMLIGEAGQAITLVGRWRVAED